MSAAQRTHFASWDEEISHRQKVHKKLDKIRGLQSLLDEWEAHPIDSDDYRDYLRELRDRLRCARVQYEAMKP
jgi:hypothetical protein